MKQLEFAPFCTSLFVGRSDDSKTALTRVFTYRNDVADIPSNHSPERNRREIGGIHHQQIHVKFGTFHASAPTIGKDDLG